jgi:hypothetical protein
MSLICGANFVTNLVTKLVLLLDAHNESLEIWVWKSADHHIISQDMNHIIRQQQQSLKLLLLLLDYNSLPFFFWSLSRFHTWPTELHRPAATATICLLFCRPMQIYLMWVKLFGGWEPWGIRVTMSHWMTTKWVSEWPTKCSTELRNKQTNTTHSCWVDYRAKK